MPDGYGVFKGDPALIPSPPGFHGRWVGRSPDSAALANRISGPFRVTPTGWAEPSHLEDLATLLAWAQDNEIALIPRGGGTGMPSGNLGQAIVLGLAESEAFRTLSEPEADASVGGASIRVGAGVTMAQVEERARAHGFHLPPLPSSAPWATVGGMIANNGAGAASFRHGAMASWVLEVEGVLANGQPVSLGATTDLKKLGVLLDLNDATLRSVRSAWPQVRKNSSGYGLDRWLDSGNAAQLAIGSEGTLLVVTAATLRLTPAAPHRGLYLLPLQDLALLPSVASEAVVLGADTCEMFGQRLLDLAKLDEDPTFAPWRRGADALILLAVSGPDRGSVSDQLASIDRFAHQLGRQGLATTDPARMSSLWNLRHRASPLIAARAAEGFFSTQFMEDSVVPVPALPAYLEALERIFREEGEGMDAVIFGHAGDGNLHVNPWINPSEAGWQDRVRNVLQALVSTVTDLGGTLAGEHGDGRLRAPFLQDIWGKTTCDLFGEVKRAFDPSGILNPGTILPLAGQDPLSGFVPGPRAWPLPRPGS